LETFLGTRKMLKIKFAKKKELGNKLMGVYDSNINTIIIQKKLRLTEKITTIIHEFGHYLIYKLGFSSDTNYVYDIVCIRFEIKREKNRIKIYKWLTSYYF